MFFGMEQYRECINTGVAERMGCINREKAKTVRSFIKFSRFVQIYQNSYKFYLHSVIKSVKIDLIIWFNIFIGVFYGIFQSENRKIKVKCQRTELLY